MIKTYPNPILRQKCEEIPVEHISDYIDLIEAMKKVITDYQALGLAANQIGETVQIIAINPQVEGKSVYKEPKIMINPKIIHKTGMQIGPEACLSFPGVFVDIKRSSWVKVQYLDSEGEEQTEELVGQEGIIVQHEIDHLQGITLVNSAPRVMRGRIMKDLKIGTRRLKAYEKRIAKLEKIGAELKKIDEEAEQSLIDDPKEVV